MDYLLKRYKNICKDEFSKYGFKSYRNNHYRVINDVFQSFNLHKSISGQECTVEFIIIPLCRESKINKSSCGADHLKEFENNYSWFMYNRHDEKSIEKCLLEMVTYMNKYLMPYFEKGDCCKKAYYEVCDFQDKHYKEGIFYASSELFYMALKSGFYDKALEHLLAMKRHTQSAYQINKEYYGDQLTSEYEQEIHNELRELDNKIKHISNLDKEYIERVILKNERINLSNLGFKMKS